MFKECSKLQFQLPQGFFRDCQSLKKVSELFYGCTGLNGTIPTGLFTTYKIDGETGEEVISDSLIDEASNVFNKCEYLRGTIPEDIFNKFYLVTNLDGFFADCRRLEGEIPPRLLYDCLSLISANSLFGQCWNLGKPRVTEEDPYFIDPEFFMYNSSLENINSIFNMWNGTSKLIGELPEDLFMYCTKLKNMANAFCNTKFTGSVSGSLFRNNKQLVTLSEAFWNASITEITADCLNANHGKITNLNRTFNGCAAATGEAPSLWTTHPSAERAECFRGCTNLSNYDDIPETWK